MKLKSKEKSVVIAIMSNINTELSEFLLDTRLDILEAIADSVETLLAATQDIIDNGDSGDEDEDEDEVEDDDEDEDEEK